MNNPGVTGLQSLQQHGVAVPGETKNIEYFFNLAKKMSDGQLADVLAGKSLNVPQFVAMTEAMGRKQLRQAVDGAQAQQQAQQPTVKDQLMAENAGLASLPAQNLENLGEGHAAGGIIAFDKGGDVFERWKQLGGWGQNTDTAATNETDAEYLKATNPAEYEKQTRQVDKWKRLAEDSKKPYLAEDFRASVVDPIKSFFTSPWDKAAIADTQKAEVSRLMKENNISAAEALKLINKSAPLPTATETAAFTGDGTSVPPATPSAGNKNDGSKGGTKNDGTKGDGSKGDGGTPLDFTFNPRKSRMEGLKTEAVDYNKIKEQGFGEGLMGLGAGLLSARGAKGMSAGIEALAKQAGLSRKEIAGLKKEERDYNFNMAKAQDAFDQGNDELGLKYKTLAETSKYHDIMGKAALMTAGAHQTTAAAASEKPDMEIFKLTQDMLKTRLKDIQFKNKFDKLSADDQMAVLKNMYQQNKAMYTGVNSPGGSPSAAPVKFLGFEPNANSQI